MDTLEDRLEQLANEEFEMLLQYQEIKVARSEEDNLLRQKREREDQHWNENRVDRDRREDEVRSEKRKLAGQMFSTLASRSEQETVPDSHFGTPLLQTPPSLTSNTGSTMERAPAKRGPEPTKDPSMDDEGNTIWIRPTDNKLVYLVCPVEGCQKKNFRTISLLKGHVTTKRGHNMGHYMGHYFTSDAQVFEICSVLIPGQDDDNQAEEDDDPVRMLAAAKHSLSIDQSITEEAAFSQSEDSSGSASTSEVEEIDIYGKSLYDRRAGWIEEKKLRTQQRAERAKRRSEVRAATYGHPKQREEGVYYGKPPPWSISKGHDPRTVSESIDTDESLGAATIGRKPPSTQDSPKSERSSSAEIPQTLPNELQSKRGFSESLNASPLATKRRRLA